MIVTDASVLTDALVDDGTTGRVCRGALTEDLHWAAPAHLVVEVVSAVRGMVLGRKITVRRGGEALDALRELTIESIDPMVLVRRMWQLRSNLTAYDAAYVAAAELLDCPLVTADAKTAGLPGLRCTIRLVARDVTA